MADGRYSPACAGRLTEQERQVLGIFRALRPDGVRRPVGCRGIHPRDHPAATPKTNPLSTNYQAYRNWSDCDPVPGLREKFVLVGPLLRLVLLELRSPPLLSINPSSHAGTGGRARPSCCLARFSCLRRGGDHRSPLVRAGGLDLWRVAEVLRSMGTWQTVKGDSPAKATRARLQKEVGLRDAEKDPMSPRMRSRCCGVVDSIDSHREWAWGLFRHRADPPLSATALASPGRRIALDRLPGPHRAQDLSHPPKVQSRLRGRAASGGHRLGAKHEKRARQQEGGPYPLCQRGMKG